MVKKQTMRRIFKKIVVLLTILSVLVCSSCAAPSLEERPELYTGEYFQDTPPSEHWYYLLDTFITLLPHLQSPKELGVSNLQYIWLPDFFKVMFAHRFLKLGFHIAPLFVFLLFCSLYVCLLYTSRCV